MSGEKALADLFEKAFDTLDPQEIKKAVDEHGIDKFISRCAKRSAIIGGICGAGGLTTGLLGLPFDVWNNVIQQFRVTLGVIYHQRGICSVGFHDFMKIVGVSVGVETGASVTSTVMLLIAFQILTRLGVSNVAGAVPITGSVVRGSVNYAFISGIGAAVKAIDMNAF
ncbi:hypothetical protein DXZ20_00175 [Leptolyngbyaceae cyanobacterium CCMR0081]|uniref:EcsC family protein n=2 Tax=Adonisia TaxID=2950183 RepID=A0A6M0RD37_9CYAN|nr:hypothetical protein [Adonisia turfae CCMR0081]